MAVHRGWCWWMCEPATPTARVLPMADTLTLPLRLLGDAAPGEILLSAQLGRLVEEWYELQAREVSLGGRPLDQASAYAIVGKCPWRSPSK